MNVTLEIVGQLHKGSYDIFHCLQRFKFDLDKQKMCNGEKSCIGEGNDQKSRNRDFHFYIVRFDTEFPVQGIQGPVLHHFFKMFCASGLTAKWNISH